MYIFFYQGWLLLISILAVADVSHGRPRRRRSTHHSHCREPKLDDDCLNSGDIHDSFLMMERNIERSYDVEEYVNIHRTPYGRTTGSDHCTWQNGNRYNSSCPHHYVTNYDENRRPERLLEAKCNCDETMPCLDGVVGSRCIPVKYYLTVLRKNGCHRGSYTYTKTIESITVGCTCAYPRTEEDTRIRYFMEE